MDKELTHESVENIILSINRQITSLEKNKTMLMKVIGHHAGLIKTEYINRVGNEPFYLNRKEVLHAPCRFNIMEW